MTMNSISQLKAPPIEAKSMAFAYSKAAEIFKGDGVYTTQLESKFEFKENNKVVYSFAPLGKPSLKIYFSF